MCTWHLIKLLFSIDECMAGVKWTRYYVMYTCIKDAAKGTPCIVLLDKFVSFTSCCNHSLYCLVQFRTSISQSCSFHILLWFLCDVLSFLELSRLCLTPSSPLPSSISHYHPKPASTPRCWCLYAIVQIVHWQLTRLHYSHSLAIPATLWSVNAGHPPCWSCCPLSPLLNDHLEQTERGLRMGWSEFMQAFSPRIKNKVITRLYCKSYCLPLQYSIISLI